MVCVEGERDPLLGEVTFSSNNSESKSKELLVPMTGSVHPLRNLCVIFITFMIYVINYNMIYPLTNQYVYYRELKALSPNITVDTAHDPCANTTGTNDTEQEAREGAESSASQWNIYFILISVVPTICVSLIYGSVSDTFGRKPLFMVSILGTMGNAIIVCCVINWQLPLQWLLLGSLLDGIGGSFAVMLIATYSAIADVVPETGKKTIYFALSNVFVGLAGLGGNLSIGIIIERLGYFYSSVVLIAVLATAELFAVFGVKETCIKGGHNRETFKISKAFKFYIKNDESYERCAYIMLVTMMFWATFPFTSRSSVETLYLENEPFCFPSFRIGIYQGCLAIRGAVSVVTIVLLQKHCTNEQMAVFSLISNITGLVVEAFSSTTWQIYLVPVISIFGTMLFPTMRGIMSELTKPEDQGSLFAGVLAIEATAGLLSGVTTNLLYKSTLSFFNGTAFLFLAGTQTIAALLMMCFIYRRKNAAKRQRAT